MQDKIGSIQSFQSGDHILLHGARFDQSKSLYMTVFKIADIYVNQELFSQVGIEKIEVQTDSEGRFWLSLDWLLQVRLWAAQP